MRDRDSRTSATTLISDVMTHAGRLAEKELALAKTEIRTSMTQIASAFAMMLVAAVLFTVVANLIAGVLVGVFAESGMTVTGATLLVCGLFAAMALGLGWKALRDLRQASFVPRRAVDNIRKDAQSVREATNG